jgi:hypothetical protein
VAGHLAGKTGVMFLPLLGAAVSSGISYWVASILLTAAESYHKNHYVQINNPGISVEDMVESAVENGGEDHLKRNG